MTVDEYLVNFPEGCIVASDFSKEAYSQAGEDNPMYGKRWNKEERKKISEEVKKYNETEEGTRERNKRTEEFFKNEERVLSWKRKIKETRNRNYEKKLEKYKLSREEIDIRDCYVVCKFPSCEKKYIFIGKDHLKSHGITTEEYKRKYGNNIAKLYNILNKSVNYELFKEVKKEIRKMNLSVERKSRKRKKESNDDETLDEVSKLAFDDCIVNCHFCNEPFFMRLSGQHTKLHGLILSEYEKVFGSKKIIELYKKVFNHECKFRMIGELKRRFDNYKINWKEEKKREEDEKRRVNIDYIICRECELNNVYFSAGSLVSHIYEKHGGVEEYKTKHKNSLIVCKNTSDVLSSNMSKTMDRRIEEGDVNTGRNKYGTVWVYSSVLDKSLYCISSYEEKALKILFEQVRNGVIKDISNCKGITIFYVDEDGKERRYKPDFVIDYKNGSRTILEVKPIWKIEHNYENYLQKKESAIKYCEKRGWKYVVWTEKKLGINK